MMTPWILFGLMLLLIETTFLTFWFFLKFRRVASEGIMTLLSTNALGNALFVPSFGSLSPHSSSAILWNGLAFIISCIWMIAVGTYLAFDAVRPGPRE